MPRQGGKRGVGGSWCCSRGIISPELGPGRDEGGYYVLGSGGGFAHASSRRRRGANQTGRRHAWEYIVLLC